METGNETFSDRPPPILEPTRELISLHKTQKIPDFSDEQENSLIHAPLYMSFDDMQTFVPSLEKFSKSEIKKKFAEKLQNPPQKQFSNFSLSQPPFSIDEQIELYQFIRFNLPIDQVFTFCPSLLVCRPLSSIKDEIWRLRSFSEEEIQKLIDKATERITIEQLSYESYENSPDSQYLKVFRCKCELQRENHYGNSISDAASKEIEDLKPLAAQYIKETINKGYLAILRTDNFSFPLTKMRTTIGRRSNDQWGPDIDLSFIPEFDCVHVSRIQCVISLLDDFAFYLENTGKLSIRVNGVQVPPAKACKLKEGYIIDIFGALLMFYPNHALIEKMSEDLVRKTTKQKKSKTKK